jgi:hypothetical protein
VRCLILSGPALSGYRDSEEKQWRISDIFSEAKGEGVSRWQELWLDHPFWALDK